MISESLRAVWAVESMRHRDSSSLIVSESVGLFVQLNPCVTRDSSSLVFYESLGAAWAVEPMRHP